jgi:hypothetical protein
MRFMLSKWLKKTINVSLKSEEREWTVRTLKMNSVETTADREIWSSHDGGYEDWCLLSGDVMWSSAYVRSLSTILRELSTKLYGVTSQKTAVKN